MTTIPFPTEGSLLAPTVEPPAAPAPLRTAEDFAPKRVTLTKSELFRKSILHGMHFWAVHLGAVVLAYYAGFSWAALGLCLFTYYLRMFGITAGYHRYFSHRAFKTSRPFQFFLAFLGTLAAQKGPLWWAAHHRHHHKHSDQEDDLHSPVRHGFLWAHAGWFLVDDYEGTQWHRIGDFAKYPELRFLNRFPLLPPLAVVGLIWYFLGFQAMVWGGLVSTVLLWHGTFTINSLSHVFGKRIYQTTDTSKNSLILALITMGEGWHNNHHFHMASANQGFRWYEVDMSFAILRALEALGIVWDVKRAPPEVVAGIKNGKSHLLEAAAA